MTTLDSSGFVRIPARIRPPRVSDKAFDGQIVVRAFLDSARHNLHGEGSLVVNTQGTQPKRKLLIDASQGTAHSIEWICLSCQNELEIAFLRSSKIFLWTLKWDLKPSSASFQ